MKKLYTLLNISAKSIRPLFVVLTVWALSSGCTKKLYSHDQVMLSYHTKDDVVRQFGQPNEIMTQNDTTQWLYDCGSSSAFANTRTKVKINGVYNADAATDVTPKNVTQFSRYTKYALFTFDQSGKVLHSKTSNVNFEQRKPKPLATLAIVLGSVAGGLLIAGYIAVANMGPLIRFGD